ncbi:MAG: hypothetical protein AAF674_12320 [Pseudomonadota bacterium]
MAQALTKHIDIKNKDQRMARIDTDAVSSVWIGGGKSNAKKIVGEEFADITGGSRINFVDKGRHENELVGLLEAVLTRSKREAPGLEGVELVSLSSDAFTIAISGSQGATNFLEFTGSAAVEAIDSVLFTLGSGAPGLGLKNAASQVTLFDTDAVNSVFIGDSDQTSSDFADEVSGSRIEIGEMGGLIAAALKGNTDPGLTTAVDGVKILGLTDQGFTLQIEGSGATADTIIFEGDAAVAALESAQTKFGDDRPFIDTQDP